MSSFEGYHPLLTPQFRFDWLTNFRLKQVAQLTENDLAATAEWINATMRDTMSRVALTWGIERRTTHKLVAWGGFRQIDLPNHVAQAYLTGPTLPQAEQQEIVDRLVAFGQAELQLTTLTLRPDHHLDDSVLTQAGFTPLASGQWRWTSR